MQLNPIKPSELTLNGALTQCFVHVYDADLIFSRNLVNIPLAEYLIYGLSCDRCEFDVGPM